MQAFICIFIKNLKVMKQIKTFAITFVAMLILMIIVVNIR
jgi:hypothetical protein